MHSLVRLTFRGFSHFLFLFFQLYLNNSTLFGDYICEAKNNLGTLKRTITLINGTKPAAPLHITLRGVNSNTFDLDVGAKRSGTQDPMNVNGYRFELLSKEEHSNNGGKWVNARVVMKDFTDGNESLKKKNKKKMNLVKQFENPFLQV